MVSLAPTAEGHPAASTPRAEARAAAAPWIAALLAFAVVVFTPQVLNDGDTFWHLAAGEWMLEHGRVLRADVFSHTAPGRSWNTHEWLAEVMMALAYRTGGWSGLVLLFGAGFAAAIAVLAQRLTRSLPPLSTACVLALAFGCMSPSLLVRPHLLALPLLAVWVEALLRAREAGRAPPLWLAGLMAVWANMHGGYVLGLALIGPFALEALLQEPARRLATLRTWSLFGFASLAGALCTPFGVSGLLYPFQIMGMASLPGITEWRPADFSRPGPLELSLLVGLYVLLSRGVRIPTVRLLLLLLLLHMALQHMRHQMVLALVGAMILAAPLGAALTGQVRTLPAQFSRRWALGCVLAVLALASLRLALPVVRTDGGPAPISALRQVPAAIAASPVFNAYGFGGYLISQGVRPFIDGRSDMYGDAFTQAYFKASKPDAATLDQLFARYDVTWTILPPDDPVVALMDRRAGWRRLYADQVAVVHVRADALAR